MIARMQKSMKTKDSGFTLIELLVVMIIIGILAAIAIPVFLNQRKKAVDTAARSDVSVLGKEIATYYVDGTAVPTVGISTTTPKTYLLNGAALGRVSDKITGAVLAATPTATNWCVQVNVEANAGTATAQKYSATNGLESGAC